MAPLIKARPGFGRKLVAPFAFEASHGETIYLVSRTEQAREPPDRCGAALDCGGGWPREIALATIRPRISRTTSSNMTAPMVE